MNEEIKHREIAGNDFYLRPNEDFYLQRGAIEDAPEWVRGYLVAMIETPPIPYTDIQGLHLEHLPIAIIACEVYPTMSSDHEPRIGWVNLGPDTKKLIGYELMDAGANPGEWWHLILDTRKHKD